MKFSIGEAAEMTGVTIKALRHYDKIGLLKPAEVSESGYRYYTEKEITLLQQILFYRELEFSLDEIKQLLSKPEIDKRQALEQHRQLLLMKRKHIDGLIRLAEETIGGQVMSKLKITADDIENTREKYANEIKEKWGDSKAFMQSEQNYASLSQGDKEKLAAEIDNIFSSFAKCTNQSPDCAKVQALVKRWQDFISANFYDCTDEILAGLGEMYIADERFMSNLDKYGEGTAALMSAAIKIYCGQ